ncbi:hypothetical protein Ct61P_03786 [Colletotrichum tofieldiae]|nr:hypothetical protein Ct61P_03786 [Colletotrichum tofieldiae]
MADKTQSCLVPYVDIDKVPADLAAAITRLPYRRNIFYLLGHSHGAFPPLMSTYAAFFDGKKRTLPLLDWQLVVLRISATLDAEYEWEVNSPVARINGMPESKLDALKQTARKGWAAIEAEPEFSVRDRAILGLVDEQLDTYNNTEETVARAKTLLSVEELVEVYIVIGLYVLIARITKGLRIDLDGDIPGLEDSLKKVVTSG